MYWIFMTRVQCIQHHLVNIGEHQFNACIRQQLANKAATDITCSKM